MSDDKLRRLREAVQFVLDMDEMRGNDFDAKYPEVGDPTDLVGVCAARLRKALAEPEPEPTPTDPERAIIGWVSDNCGLTVAQEAELARRLESLRQPAPPLTGPNYMDQEEWGHAPAPATDAEQEAVNAEVADFARVPSHSMICGHRSPGECTVACGGMDAIRGAFRRAKAESSPATDAEIDDAMWRYRDAAISVGLNGDGHGSMAEYGERLRALIARRVAWACAEAQQELADLHAELDEVRDERNEARAELARLRAGGCARDQTTTQWCAEAVELQREVERLRAELAAKGGS